ncbi:MAG: hypothetical protein IJN81_07150 [Clostridia bacterium]|nr:hypothetical protein [Clostridia bacterium]
MSLKDKLTQIAGMKVVEQLASPNGVENAVNSLLNKIGKATGQCTTDEYINNIQKNYLIVKYRSFTIADISNILMNKKSKYNATEGMYCVCDSNGDLKYKTSDDTGVLTDKDTYHLYDADKNELGKIKEKLFSVGVPLLEKEVKKSEIFLGDEKLCMIKGYESFGDKCFDIYESVYRIEYNKGKNILIKRNKETIATLHKVPYNLKEGYTDKYVVEYNDVKNELLAVLLTIGFDTVN